MPRQVAVAKTLGKVMKTKVNWRNDRRILMKMYREFSARYGRKAARVATSREVAAQRHLRTGGARRIAARNARRKGRN